VIDNGSQVIAEMGFSFWISLWGIYANDLQLRGCKTFIELNMY
jgi:hypothetical protein